MATKKYDKTKTWKKICANIVSDATQQLVNDPQLDEDFLKDMRVHTEDLETLLGAEERPIRTLHRVLDTCEENTLSFDIGEIGVGLAYLALAVTSHIVKGNLDDCFVMWERKGEEKEIYKLFKELFPKSDPIWKYIQLV